MPKKMTLDEFIVKAKYVHGDDYDYSLVDYVNASTKVEIVCNRCGNHFLQLAGNHLKGKGCRGCSLSQVETRGVRQETFIKKAKDVHGDKYDYSMVDYIDNRTYVRIRCNRCFNIIETTPSNHLRGSDCRCRQKDKIEQTSLERYGYTNAMLDPKIAQRVQDTNMDRYGAPFYTSTGEFRERSYNSLMEKYGVSHISQSSFYQENKDAIVAKIHGTMKRNNSYVVSKSELKMYDILVQKFGVDDVERQYKSELYPFACDFYVKSLDLYIELNGHWTHGERFYNESEQYTIDFLKRLNNNQGRYYTKAKYIFSKLDVEKYMTAKKNQLNYLVFWDSKLKDVEVWLASGCPIGHDYGVMYSWLPERHFEPIGVKYTGTNSNISKYVQDKHFFEFNKRELMLWYDNNQHKGLTLQMFLYHNRLQYLGKTPFELTNLELLRAFTISGVLRRYSRFDNKLMVDVLEKYKPCSIYDPFAGWGERLLTAKKYSVEYFGVDVNDALKVGYDQFDIDCSVIFDNSLNVLPQKEYDMILSCPPYHDIEMYTDKGLENLKYDEFLLSFSKVVDNCLVGNPKYVCFQISDKNQKDIELILLSKGLVKIDELKFDAKKVSHLTRKTKKYQEVMLVFGIVGV